MHICVVMAAGYWYFCTKKVASSSTARVPSNSIIFEGRRKTCQSIMTINISETQQTHNKQKGKYVCSTFWGKVVEICIDQDNNYEKVKKKYNI